MTSKKSLLLHPISGFSGDMFVSSFYGLAKIEPEYLQTALELPELQLTFPVIKKGNIKSYKLNIYYVGNELFNTYKDLKKKIQTLSLSKSIINDSLKILRLLGEAEAAFHNVNIEDVHFHEIGNIDTLIDIVSFSILYNQLKPINKVYCLPICTGFGFIETSHGILDVPTPATKFLLHNFPQFPGKVMRELVTPTGAAILKFLAPLFNVPAYYSTLMSIGNGEMELSHPNILKVEIIDLHNNPFSEYEKDTMIVIETNIDDMNPELLGNEFVKGLFSLGIKDYYISSVSMKKGRHGLLINVLCNEKILEKTVNYLFINTTTIGVRYYKTSRIKLKRKEKVLQTEFGPVKFKQIEKNNKSYYYIEYDECLRVASQMNKPIIDIFTKLQQLIKP